MAQVAQVQLKEKDPQLLLEQKEDEEFEGSLFKPRDIAQIWHSLDPKLMVINKIMKYVNESGFNSELDEFEMRYEEDDVAMIAEFNIHNIVFCIDKLNISDNTVISRIVNSFFEIANPFKDVNRNDHSNLKLLLKHQFDSKLITKDNVIQLLDYFRRTYCKHSALYSICNQKQPKRNKVITLYEPEPQIATNLQTYCKEIIDEVPVDYDALRRQQESLTNLSKLGDGQGNLDDELEDEIDPENPLYGLEQRLRNMNLDEDSLRIVREKLLVANIKIKGALEERQKNLDSKLGEKPGAKKK